MAFNILFRFFGQLVITLRQQVDMFNVQDSSLTVIYSCIVFNAYLIKNGRDAF